MKEGENAGWRLLVSPPASGPENMALDQAILESVTAGQSPPTLRFYAWEPPCLSLGQAQSIEDVDLERLNSLGWDLVRRQTGGRAILHTDELTYAVAAPAGSSIYTDTILESYRRISLGLSAGLRFLGLTPEVQPELKAPRGANANPICFEVPSSYEITVGDKKLIGSAQVRRRGAILQHGSLPLGGDIARICQVLRHNSRAERQESAHRLRRRASTMADLLGTPVTWEQAVEAMIDGFRSTMGWRLERGDLLPSERLAAQALVKERYGHPAWTTKS